MKTGRNHPCPCGSGKKYKHCCLTAASAISEELKELLSAQEFDSIEEVRAAAEQLIADKNQKPQDIFFDLSPDQVFKMLNYPFESPDLCRFSNHLSIEPVAPILKLMTGIISAIDDKGLPATKARGSLPQKLCRKLWGDYCELYPDDEFLSFHKVNKEDDFFELHVARIVLELAGFLRKVKGRFYVTRKYQKIVAKSGLRGIYPIIFKVYCREFNWGYWDHFSEASIIQQSFLFTLYLLNIDGEKMVCTSVYEDKFLQAFPMVIAEMESSPYSTPDEDFRRCYYYRAYKRFLVFLGLAELEVVEGSKAFENKSKVKKTPLFDSLIYFESK